MSFDVTIAGKSIPTNTANLKSFPNNLNLAFNLGNTLVPLLNTTLGSVPTGAGRSNVSYTSPAASWTPGGGPVQFGLQGGASGALEVVTSGDLIAYTDGLDSPQQKSIPIPANLAYLKLTLNFNISANVSGNYSSGPYGVKAALDTKDTYAITFCKAFAPSTLVVNAIAQTFESFVLPLHKDTLAQMSDGDYLLHEFDGNLNLSFGAYVGLDKVLYAGQSSADVLKAFGSPLATLSAQTKPEIKAGVTLDFSFQYATKFEALLSKIGRTARLHLFRSKNATTSTSLMAGLTFNGNTTANIASKTQTLQDTLIKAAGGTGSAGGAVLNQVVKASNAGSEVDKYVGEVNDKLAAWLKKANGLKANLQVAIEASDSRTILAGYDFDLGSTRFADAWQAANDGDFVKAFQTGAVTLDIGSGLERAYQSRTSFSCNFFNLWHFKTWQEFSSNVSLVYAGNNVFHFIAKVGRTTETEYVGAMHSMDFYFAANADTTGTVASNIQVDLHIDLTAKSDPKAADRIATMLSAIKGGPACDDLARAMHAFAANSQQGTTQLQITIPSSAYSRVNCDPYIGDKPQTTSVYHDSVNWNTFAQAADDLLAWPIRTSPVLNTGNRALFESFGGWGIWNETTNGATTPNRVNSGNRSIWPDINQGFPSLDDSTRQFVVASMLAGQSFMNFCADLRALATELNGGSVGTTWEDLLQQITNAIRKDLDVDFIRPAALAIIRLCKNGGAPSAVTGPNSAAVPTDHFAVSITL
jgi:hypothetical protein